MLELVGELVDSGHAYVVDGKGVYFDVTKYAGYGELPHRNLDQLLESAGARVDVDESKRNPVDFALWKAAKPGEPIWDSPWGPGRPGWHLECTAMSLRELGEGFDLHGAGDDLVFPHNENERAQAEAAGHAFAASLDPFRDGRGRRREDVEVARQLHDVAGRTRRARCGRSASPCCRCTTGAPRSWAMRSSPPRAAVDRLDALVRRAAAAGVDVAGAAPDGEIVERFRDAMDDDFATPDRVGGRRVRSGVGRERGHRRR